MIPGPLVSFFFAKKVYKPYLISLRGVEETFLKTPFYDENATLSCTKNIFDKFKSPNHASGVNLIKLCLLRR
jgi:hypothetical protein